MPDKSLVPYNHAAIESKDGSGDRTLQKRRSCEMVTTPSPCVKKALFHLERIKHYLQETCIKDGDQESEVGTLSHSILKPIGQEKAQKKQLRFLTPVIEYSPNSEQDEATSEKSLSVQGSGYVSDDSQAIAQKSMFKKQISSFEVFNQVAELLQRLEDDRIATLKALEIERNRFKNLSWKIDMMSQRRIVQLPMAVQKEHDACAFDISELQWHVSYTERQLERSKERVTAAQVLNDSLNEDINFVKKHCPLVEEKLTMEKEAMKKIRTTQKATDGELSDAKVVLDHAEEKYQEALETAERERQKTSQDLDAVRGQLTMLKKDLHHSEAMYQAYLKKADQSREKLSNQGDELTALEKKTEELRELEQKEVYRIEELQDEVKQVEFETGEVTKQKNKLENEIDQMHQDMRGRISDIEGQYKDSLRTLRELQENNRDMKYDIEDMNEEIKTCDKAVAKAERESERFAKEKERCEIQLKNASDDVTNITMINIELKTQLEKEETKSQALEDALKSSSENLRKQVNEEMRQKTALESKRNHNSTALLKGKSENVKKKIKVEKTLEETQNAVAKAVREVKALQEQHEKSLHTVTDLEQRLTALNAEHESTEKDLTQQKNTIEPVERKLQEEQMELKSKIKEMEFEELQMNQKLKDMTVSQNAMQKRINTAETNIAKLKEELNELQIKLETGENTNQNLQKKLDEATGRLDARDKQHKQLMAERIKVKEQLEENVRLEVESNKKVAQKYRVLQSEHIDLKNRFMSMYDNKVKMEASIKDHKQLLKLQEKLNSALRQYYYDRGKFNQAGLTKFYVQSHNNTNMMTNVQKGLDIAIDNISLFLKSQIDGSATNRVHQAAMEWLETPS
uniref:Coiled-coil domain-containing protein 178-like n=1 Tax=Phallusia mammillata TaxID=59560 RepID=A0A6F9D951_9ASCI|nr:coiled-coil domain-containing protein 178-like [Phallusia mammillata]